MEGRERTGIKEGEGGDRGAASQQGSGKGREERGGRGGKGLE